LFYTGATSLDTCQLCIVPSDVFSISVSPDLWAHVMHPARIWDNSLFWFIKLKTSVNSCFVDMLKQASQLIQMTTGISAVINTCNLVTGDDSL